MEGGRDAAVGEAASDQLQDILLAPREPFGVERNLAPYIIQEAGIHGPEAVPPS
jgi:hypothetical protein